MSPLRSGSRSLALALVIVGAGVSMSACGDETPAHQPRPHTDRASNVAQKRAAQKQRAAERRQHRRMARMERQRQRRHRQQRRQELADLGCPNSSRTLKGVYHPERLSVLDPCRTAVGTVATIREEEDGDVHIGVKLRHSDRSMLTSGNFSGQGGNLVVEFMPRDFGHLSEPGVGDKVSLVGAYVNDTQHGWAELHPVWSVSINGGPIETSGPQFGGSSPSALSDSAIATCQTDTGAPCMAYGGGVAPPPQDESGGQDGGGGGKAGSGCDPNYTGACVPPYPPDVDCGDLSGPVHVVGSDPHGLDADGDGTGCEG